LAATSDELVAQCFVRYQALYSRATRRAGRWLYLDAVG